MVRKIIIVILYSLLLIDLKKENKAFELPDQVLNDIIWRSLGSAGIMKRAVLVEWYSPHSTRLAGW